VQYPSSDNEDLVIAWLWSAAQGVASHETALSLHHLSDVLPADIHLTVPSMWKKRRLVVPPIVLLHYSDLSPSETSWFGAVPVTNPLRTIRDCLEDALSPDLLHQAIAQGIRRGLFNAEDIDSSKVEP
jgi:predicted transcriptional regulator of viral defense system